MLTQARVLNYIKDNLGFNFMAIELTDQQIINFFVTYSLRTFSQYFPDVNRINMNPLLESNQVPGRGNEYYINDDEGLEILSVKNIYFDRSDLYANCHPPIGPFSLGELKNWALDVHNAGMLKMFGNYDRTFEFMHPNKVRISPTPNNIRAITIEYERIHREDLGTIPNEFQVIFCDLSLADCMISLGRIRKRYGDGTLRTPFGEIPLGSDIFEEGKELRREVLEKLWTGSHYNMDVDIG
jgi:hypothetical protein